MSLNPIYNDVLPHSLLKKEGRIAFLFPGIKELMVIEFPPDDPTACFFAAMTDSPALSQISLQASPKQHAKWARLREQLDDPAVTEQLNRRLTPEDFKQLMRARAYQPVYEYVPTLNYYEFSANDRSQRWALQAHPIWSRNVLNVLQPGKGSVCSLEGGASLGCAFISRVSHFDGVHFNDPLAAGQLSRSDATGLGFNGSSESLLNLLIDYTYEKRDLAEELIAQFRGG